MEERKYTDEWIIEEDNIRICYEKVFKCHEKEVVSKGWKVTIDWVAFLKINFNVEEE